MSTEPFIGEVKLFGFYFAPKGHTYCNGQTIAIASNTALFSLLGTAFGGNGQTTFGLPNLQGRMAIGQGNGAGLPSHTIGEMAGNVQTTLTTSNLPPHTHNLSNTVVKIAVNGVAGDGPSPENSFPGTNNTYSAYAESPTANTTMNPGSVTVNGMTDISGSNYPISIANPYLVMNFCIATQGVFPSRN
ncbi:MAG: tail fiber protein [Bacteroidia bacterium]|jgi:microcystin-dependent protein|nr:tail fiber protein [Bacteroidia bacterium]